MTKQTAPRKLTEETLMKMARKMEEKAEPGIRVLTQKEWRKELLDTCRA